MTAGVGGPVRPSHALIVTRRAIGARAPGRGERSARLGRVQCLRAALGCRSPGGTTRRSTAWRTGARLASRSARAASFDDYVLDLQDSIVRTTEQQIESSSGAKFITDRWERENDSGFGITRVLEGGSVVEKAASNVSIIRGTLTKARAQAMSSRGRPTIDPDGGQAYAAAAMSLVFHSAHPHIPTLRADVRVFEVEGQKWFGGGCDLTPFYVHDEDFKEFHRYWKGVCDAFTPDGSSYGAYKAWCDDYFYIPARKEHRGIGGLFFDDLDDVDNGTVEAFVRNVGDGILPSWMPIVARRREMPVVEEERAWQLLRRGRYLEFNLLYDRGVKFGLEGGRIESIMVSAPPLISWKYNVVPEAGSREAELLALLSGTPKSWV